MSALAPFTALLVGAGVSQMTRIGGPLMLAAGALTEAVVIPNSATDLSWASRLIVGASLAAAIGLALVDTARVRRAIAPAGVTVLLAAPASWAVQTLGHATAPPSRPAAPRRPRRWGGMGGGFGGGTPPTGGTGGPGGGGGNFGGDTSELTAALAYAKAHGGGTVVISSQSGATRRSSPRAPTSPRSAGSPAARRRSPPSGWRTRSPPGRSAGSS